MKIRRKTQLKMTGPILKISGLLLLTLILSYEKARACAASYGGIKAQADNGIPAFGGLNSAQLKEIRSGTRARDLQFELTASIDLLTTLHQVLLTKPNRLESCAELKKYSRSMAGKNHVEFFNQNISRAEFLNIADVNALLELYDLAAAVEGHLRDTLAAVEQFLGSQKDSSSMGAADRKRLAEQYRSVDAAGVTRTLFQIKTGIPATDTPVANGPVSAQAAQLSNLVESNVPGPVLEVIRRYDRYFTQLGLEFHPWFAELVARAARFQHLP